MASVEFLDLCFCAISDITAYTSSLQESAQQLCQSDWKMFLWYWPQAYLMTTYLLLRKASPLVQVLQKRSTRHIFHCNSQKVVGQEDLRPSQISSQDFCHILEIVISTMGDGSRICSMNHRAALCYLKPLFFMGPVLTTTDRGQF